jgi:CPA2 family monovalent cation:H+ antiporter-2
VRQTLLHFEVPATEIEHLSDAIRTERYQPFETLHTDAQLLSQLRRARNALDVEWLTLPPDAPFVGQPIAASGIRERTGASIAALLRDGALLSNPGPDEVLQSGQSIAILGTLEQRNAFRAWVHAGAETGLPDAAGRVVAPVELPEHTLTRAARMLRETREQDG